MCDASDTEYTEYVCVNAVTYSSLQLFTRLLYLTAFLACTQMIISSDFICILKVLLLRANRTI